MIPANDKNRERVLVLAPTGRDGTLITEAVSPHGLTTEICADAAGVAAELPKGAGVVLIAEEALTPESIGLLRQAFGSQPPWSDLPILVLSIAGESTPLVEHSLKRWTALGNVTVIERPVRPATLVSVITAALRARRRQYEVQRLFDNMLVAEERLRSMIESAQDYAIINLNLAGEVTYWNAGAERLLGYAETAIFGRLIDIVFSEEDRRSGVPAGERDTALRTGHAETEGWRVRQDGSRFWASGVVSPTRDAAGRVIGFVKVLRDMTAQKRSEERLAEQARALQRSNDDLQRFAYVASHDLQEPLRAIGSYSQLLVRKAEGRLDEDSEQFVRFIVEGVERMRTLIHDLLEFSRLTSSEPEPPERVDCNAVLGLALQHLQPRIAASGAKIRFDRMPVVLGNESRLLQVFQNLIGNALKYCDTTPEISISVVREHDFWRIVIRDNGIGIAPEHHEEIFGLFRRLHSRAKYPGTGIGLATCKRIVEQLGGRIWVKSSPGAGSEFSVTLPAAEADVSPQAKAARVFVPE
jgi:PAS domain S-box-containing protein